MRKQLVKFLEDNFGCLERFEEHDLHVDEYPFCNDEMQLQNVQVVGDSDCFSGNEFYQFAIDGDHLYKAYYEIPEDEDGIELDSIDYTHAYRIEDVTEEYV